MPRLGYGISPRPIGAKLPEYNFPSGFVFPKHIQISIVFKTKPMRSSDSTLQRDSLDNAAHFVSVDIFNEDDDEEFQISLTQALPPLDSISPTKPHVHSNCADSSSALENPEIFNLADIADENIPSGSGHYSEFNPQSSQNIPITASTSLDSRRNESGLAGLALGDSEELDYFDWNSDCTLDSIQPSVINYSYMDRSSILGEDSIDRDTNWSFGNDEKKGLNKSEGYQCKSIESRLVKSGQACSLNITNCSPREDISNDFEAGGEIDVLLKLCSQVGDKNEFHGVEYGEGEMHNLGCGRSLVLCPLCGIDITDLTNDQRQVHTNDCIDKGETHAHHVAFQGGESGTVITQHAGDNSRLSPVCKWLHELHLSRYEDAFVREEIDWESLKWLTEEDLLSIGVTAFGPRKKIIHALSELRMGTSHAVEKNLDSCDCKGLGSSRTLASEGHNVTSENQVDESSKLPTNKLITDYFSGFSNARKKVRITSTKQDEVVKKSSGPGPGPKDTRRKSYTTNRKRRDLPLWCCIPGTPFRVDAFQYLRGDCSHWFLSHFHMDHYQGLTKSFCHGKIYCSHITAKLVNMKIGIPWERLQVLPLNEKINVAGVDVTCLDANHCPGAIIILFEPPNGKAVLHTGDFRFCDQMASLSIFQTHHICTLILDTTYCNPLYDFPKQEAVIQFVLDAIQAESFNPKTLFLIGSYTIGKERIFLEVARVLRKKVYVAAAKLRILRCLGFPAEDMQWFTSNEKESHVHIVPMWAVASFKRLKHMSTQYAGRYNLIVAFSPTGWTFGKGKKSPGRKLQQGTIIRYEVPYSEHSSFTELKEFVKLVSPEKIVPSVNNHGPDSATSMISLLSS